MLVAIGVLTATAAEASSALRILQPNHNVLTVRIVCDGIPDCSDGSDEVDCVCSDDQFQCSRCERGEGCVDPFYCLPRANVGDGRRDCWSEDEEK